MQVVKDEPIEKTFLIDTCMLKDAEADDIIAVLSKVIKEDILIISVTKDFQQLQKYDNTIQCHPI